MGPVVVYLGEQPRQREQRVQSPEEEENLTFGRTRQEVMAGAVESSMRERQRQIIMEPCLPFYEV